MCTVWAELNLGVGVPRVNLGDTDVKVVWSGYGNVFQLHPRLLLIICILLFLFTELTLMWAFSVLDISSIKTFSHHIIDVLCHWSLVCELV